MNEKFLIFYNQSLILKGEHTMLYVGKEIPVYGIILKDKLRGK
jgi:hypothetical protein